MMNVTALIDPYAAAIAAELKTFNFILRIKKQIRGINKDINMAATTVGNTGPPNPLLFNSSPPLKPIAKRRYSENNLGKGEGISRSDLSRTAKPPRKKKRTGGVNTF